jgi:hypothetical protein
MSRKMQGQYSGARSQEIVGRMHKMVGKLLLKEFVMIRSVVLLSILAIVGCKAEVNAPGVSVKVGPDGAKVSAPGVKVEAGSGGAKVDVEKK